MQRQNVVAWCKVMVIAKHEVGSCQQRPYSCTARCEAIISRGKLEVAAKQYLGDI